MEKVKVGILGATGMVGQRFVQLLAGHPWFEITEVAASERSAGRSYGEVMQGRWKVEGEIPPEVAHLQVKECVPELDCRLVFSALDAKVAGPIEEEFAKAGYVVSSNARNHRMDPDVPLLVPEVNPDHTEIIPQQRKRWPKGGYIVTNPNCSTIGLVMALAPLYRRFGLKRVMVTTLQALSGAGYPGVASLDILDNAIPFISGEEAKVESEPLKILGRLEGGRFIPAEIAISASCTRVNVRDGHLESVSVELERKASPEELIEAWEGYNPLAELGLPSAPEHPILYRREEDRPQPLKDRDAGRGMSCTVGRLRKCSVLDYKFFLLSHNTIRGAAGAAILNAEYLLKKGYL
ncbi:MAG: aspartate-semialdehyde dehydrogenase [Deltaproteobacteria bacterium]|nr:MAG: aspartate-semialdehyde dehydrogenase [Deltaproteobacteria bacterium]HEX15761.1 aspartate-semialdehyde dehydrogenase [Deltaproteobacteria bacterium]